jgi:hypothetical protein
MRKVYSRHINDLYKKLSDVLHEKPRNYALKSEREDAYAIAYKTWRTIRDNNLRLGVRTSESYAEQDAWRDLQIARQRVWRRRHYNDLAREFRTRD